MFGTSLSPPTTSGTSRRREELSAPLPAAGAVSPPRWLSGSGLREAGRRAGRLPTFPKHNPREILTPGGRGGGGAGTKTGGADFNPDPLRTPSARLWPRGAGDGPRDVQSIRRDACRKEMVLLEAKFFLKKSTSPTASLAAASRTKQRRAAIGDREAPGARNLTSARARSRGGRCLGWGRRPAPAVRSAAAGPGLRLCAAPPPGSRRPPARRALRVPALGCCSLATRQLSPSVPSPSVGVRASLPPSNAGNAQKTSEREREREREGEGARARSCV